MCCYNSCCIACTNVVKITYLIYCLSRKNYVEIRRGCVFIDNTHHQAWGCLLAIRTVRRGAVYWQYAPSGLGLCLLAVRAVRCGAVFIGNTHHRAWGCLLAIRTVRRGAVYWQYAPSGVGLFIGNTHRQVWGNSPVKCLSESSDLPAPRSLYRPKCALTADTGNCDVTCVTLGKVDSVNV